MTEDYGYNLDDMRQAAQTEAQMQLMDQTAPGFTNVIKFLADDKSYPQHIKERFWAPSDKENVLARLNEKDVKKLCNKKRMIDIAYMVTCADGEYTWDDFFQMHQTDYKTYLKLKGRSEGGFERIQQTVQTRKMELTGGSRPMLPKQGVLGKFPIVGKLLGRGGRQ